MLPLWHFCFLTLICFVLVHCRYPLQDSYRNEIIAEIKNRTGEKKASQMKASNSSDDATDKKWIKEKNQELKATNVKLEATQNFALESIESTRPFSEKRKVSSPQSFNSSPSSSDDNEKTKTPKKRQKQNAAAAAKTETVVAAATTIEPPLLLPAATNNSYVSDSIKNVQCTSQGLAMHFVTIANFIFFNF